MFRIRAGDCSAIRFEGGSQRLDNVGEGLCERFDRNRRAGRQGRGPQHVRRPPDDRGRGGAVRRLRPVGRRHRHIRQCRRFSRCAVPGRNAGRARRPHSGARPCRTSRRRSHAPRHHRDRKERGRLRCEPHDRGIADRVGRDRALAGLSDAARDAVPRPSARALAHLPALRRLRFRLHPGFRRSAEAGECAARHACSGARSSVMLATWPCSAKARCSLLQADHRTRLCREARRVSRHRAIAQDDHGHPQRHAGFVFRWRAVRRAGSCSCPGAQARCRWRRHRRCRRGIDAPGARSNLRR